MAFLENQNQTQGQSGPDITHLEATQHDSTTGTATLPTLLNELIHTERVEFRIGVFRVLVTLDWTVITFWQIVRLNVLLLRCKAIKATFQSYILQTRMTLSRPSLSYQQLTTQWLYWARWPLPFSCVWFCSSCWDVGDSTTESKLLSKAQTVWTNPQVSNFCFNLTDSGWNLPFR